MKKTFKEITIIRKPPLIQNGKGVNIIKSHIFNFVNNLFYSKIPNNLFN
ncbi:MAG: hypothetical protein HeimC3_00930 [Candidatus Heimdallarchaeota archaeon LC_3]|nr:MAG: hypothetical protein HeimC3_00930 [Candidatus Heimdallarchaeota archaeon LC_3]